MHEQTSLFGDAPPSIHRTARFSPCERYRYNLGRSWRAAGAIDPVVWIMLNPSTADAYKDDPTVKRCMAFARRWGFDCVEVVNLFAFRTPSPAVLKAWTGDRVGPENDRAIREAVERAGLVVAAWGTHGALDGRADAVLAMLEGRAAGGLHTLKLTTEGHPQHPLARGRHRVPNDASAVRWR